jgi:triacylglycerol esterase/lipase EstA (alpha/beta hydrolase family)
VVAKQEDTWGPFGLRLLHSPPEPLIDFIFVHGLRGGSVKTWCGSDDLRLFWPQAWLPRDPDLQLARIHSFGYNSDWGDSKETSLDLHDFGKSLLGEMSASPTLNSGDQIPIILIGHSMGGLVIKKVRFGPVLIRSLVTEGIYVINTCD